MLSSVTRNTKNTLRNVQWKKKKYSLIQDTKGLTLEITFGHPCYISGTATPSPFTDPNEFQLIFPSQCSLNLWAWGACSNRLSDGIL